MRPDQSLPELTARLLLRLDRVFADEAPDAVLAQGDTTTAMAVALAAFYTRIPVGHVEAGLRTGDLHSPYPEEMKRIVARRLSRWHFVPTTRARDNLPRRLESGSERGCAYGTVSVGAASITHKNHDSINTL